MFLHNIGGLIYEIFICALNSHIVRTLKSFFLSSDLKIKPIIRELCGGASSYLKKREMKLYSNYLHIKIKKEH